ncbi:MAG: hypothetical protein JRC53_03970 [Deltaproteobacteria bacterium]|nr:hypothetical protein [Deltaproteobacteria bacterium]
MLANLYSIQLFGKLEDENRKTGEETMGIILELTRARRRIKELEEQNSKLLELLTPPEPPATEGIIAGANVRAAFLEVFPDSAQHIYVSDTYYRITTIRNLRKFVEWDNTNTFGYISERHDCDDFSFSLMGAFARYPDWSSYPVAIIWADYGIGPHAFTAAVAWESYDNRVPRVYYIEPQNDWEISEESMAEAKLYLLVV